VKCGRQACRPSVGMRQFRRFSSGLAVVAAMLAVSPDLARAQTRDPRCQNVAGWKDAGTQWLGCEKYEGSSSVGGPGHKCGTTEDKLSANAANGWRNASSACCICGGGFIPTTTSTSPPTTPAPTSTSSTTPPATSSTTTPAPPTTTPAPPCPANSHYTAAPTQNSSLRCLCRPGFFAGAEDVCTPCAAGSMSNLSGATSCYICWPGMFSPSNASMCSACDAGTFSRGNASTCQQCSAGKISSSTRSSTCTDCAAGNSGGDLSVRDRCAGCEAGSYSSTPAAPRCQRCAASTFSNARWAKEPCMP
jgi:hypothetical protein